MCLKFPLSPYIMLRTYNIVWRKFCSLFLNIVKKGEEGRNIKLYKAFFPIIFFTDFSSSWKKKRLNPELEIVAGNWTFPTQKWKPPVVWNFDLPTIPGNIVIFNPRVTSRLYNFKVIVILYYDFCFLLPMSSLIRLMLLA